jgi:hypothetical protein
MAYQEITHFLHILAKSLPEIKGHQLDVVGLISEEIVLEVSFGTWTARIGK